jgi:hypothetical protein
MGRTACTEPQCLYKGALYLTSVRVQWCTLPLRLPQCLYKGALYLYVYLSACTRLHFTLPQCLYKGALYLYVYLSACTRVTFTLTFLQENYYKNECKTPQVFRRDRTIRPPALIAFCTLTTEAGRLRQHVIAFAFAPLLSTCPA